MQAIQNTVRTIIHSWSFSHRHNCANQIWFLLLFLNFGFSTATLAAPPGAAPPPVVVTMTVTEQAVTPSNEYVGRMEAIQAVDLRARVEGVLEKVAFQEGADVNEGELLYLIEQAPYRAKLNQAQAMVSENEAALKKARLYLQRLNTVQSGGVSASDLDTAASTEQQTIARLMEARASLELAKLNLNYTTIQAPIGGRIGRTAVTKGNLVGPSSGTLARIVQLDPIRAVYSMSEIDFTEKQLMLGSGGGRAEIKARFVPRLKMADGSIFPHDGRLDFIDNQVDPGTGTIAMRAVFDNPQAVLLPGQYVTVRVSPKEAQRLPVIPQSAVLEDRQGRYVFVVDDRNTARLRRITTGTTLDTRWSVESGLKAGDTIVVQGVQKIRPDLAVNPKSDDQPAVAPRKE